MQATIHAQVESTLKERDLSFQTLLGQLEARLMQHGDQTKATLKDELEAKLMQRDEDTFASHKSQLDELFSEVEELKKLNTNLTCNI